VKNYMSNLKVAVNKPVRFFDLFCGGGGSSRGALMAGATPVAGLDTWKMAAETYEANFPDATVFAMDASSLSPERFRHEVGEIDLMLASPECTSHSVAKGGKPGCEASRETAFEVIRFAEFLKPRWVIVENVLAMRKWSRFDEWYEALEAIGYELKAGVLDAQYFDTPQSRPRFFVVGDLQSVPSLPNPGPRTSKTVYSILGHGESKENPWGFSSVVKPRRAAATIVRAERAIETLGDGIPFIMVYYGTDGAGGFQTMDRPLRTVTTLDRFAYVKPNGNGYEMRMLQPPELAAAMGFPDGHRWPDASRRTRIRLIGNAVCPPVMKALVKALVGPISAKD
jgi:DNA (cytosine-5)-methyltransferase 1